jgi:hypothetical protein
MAMLPDTLGTRAFMKAANYITIPKADGGRQRFLDIVGTARQDSGELRNFIRNMKEFGYTSDGTPTGAIKAMMASEIDFTHKLLEAAQLNYASFGAGGFFGDSEKVWGNPKASSNSMAVKAVRVKYVADAGLDYAAIGYMRKVGDVVVGFPTKVMGYPVKIGDQDDFDHPQLAEGKLFPNSFKDYKPIYDSYISSANKKKLEFNIEECVFDKITSNDINKYLQSFMKDLTAKLFRTYNASNIFQKEFSTFWSFHLAINIFCLKIKIVLIKRMDLLIIS